VKKASMHQLQKTEDLFGLKLYPGFAVEQPERLSIEGKEI